MEPLNYSFQAPNIGDQFLQGLQVTQAMQAQQAAQEQAKAKAEADARFQSELQAVANNPNRTVDDYRRLATIRPDLSEKLMKTSEGLAPQERQARVNSIMPVFAAVRGGKLDVAKNLLAEQEEAATNAGNQQGANAARAMRLSLDLDPSGAEFTMASVLSNLDEKFPENYSKLTTAFNAQATERRTEALFPAAKREAEAKASTQVAIAENAPQAEREKVIYQQVQTKKLRAEIDNMSSRLALDRDKLDFEVQSSLDKLSGNPLSGDAAKIVNESVMQAGKLKTQASQAKSLADKFEKEGGGFGFGSTIAEKFAQFTGSQDTVTALRQEFERVSASNVISLLPPGPATDKDIAIIRAGFPPATADSRTIADFLRSMARVQEYEALSKDAQAAWVDMTGSLGTARKGTEVNGIRVPAGTRYQDFAQTYIKRQELSQKYGN